MKLQKNVLAQMREVTKTLLHAGPESATKVIQKALGGLLPGHGAATPASPADATQRGTGTGSKSGSAAGNAAPAMHDINPPPASAARAAGGAQSASTSTSVSASARAAAAAAEAAPAAKPEAAPESTPQAAPLSAQEMAHNFAQDFAQDFMSRLGVPNMPNIPNMPNMATMPDMSKLGNLPAGLGSFDLPGFGGTSKTPSALPEGAQFISGAYSNHAGQRDYKLYIPSSFHGQAMPLVVMLHGCTQNPDDFAAGTQMNAVAEEKQCFVVYPAQTSGANSSRCWNWFNALDQQRDQGEPSIIAGIARQVMDEYPVDERQVYVAGLSAGGAMAVIVGTLYPDVFAAVGVHSGLPFASARDLPSALAAMRSGGMAGQAATAPGGGIPIIVFHGDRDTTVNPRNGEELIAQGLRDQAGHHAAASVDSGSVPNGHSYTRTTHRHKDGSPLGEHWVIHGAGHAWSGGSAHGTYTDHKGPDASREMMRFFGAVS